MRVFAGMVVGMMRTGGGMLSTGGLAAFFALLAASLFGIALAPLPQASAAAAPAVIWLCVLVAATVSLETVWHRPLSDGKFDLLLLSGVPALTVTAAMTLAHWLMAGVPLIVTGGALGVMLALPVAALPALTASLCCATLYLSLTGAIAALLTHGARQPGVLLVVLILPLQLPMLLLALMAVERALLDPAALNSYVYLQAALLVFALPLLAGGAAWLLRFQLLR